MNKTVCAAVTIPAIPPFRLDLTVWALRRRAKNIIDGWDGRNYTRILASDSGPIKIDISQRGTIDSPLLQVTLRRKVEISVQTQEEIRSLTKTMLGLAIDLRAFYALSEKSDILTTLVKQFSGLKPPRFPSLFEALVNAIACQQVSLDAGTQILNRFSERFGVQFDDGRTILFAFPRPKDVTSASEGDIKEIGFSRQKAQSIRELAINAENHKIDLMHIDRMTNTEITNYLSTIRGIGRWSTEYVLLRGLGRLDTFPGDDIGAKNNLQRLFHLEKKPDYEQINRLTSQWQPYQGLVYFHLLLNNLRAKGLI